MVCAIADERAALEVERRGITFGEYATTWISHRTVRGRALADRTKEEYERMLLAADDKIGGKRKDGPLAVFAATPIGEITPDAVRRWYSELVDCGTVTTAARAYDLMKSIMKTAVEDDDLIERNPCRIKGASNARTGVEVTPPTEAELDKILEVIDDRFGALVVIAAAAGLRFGELTELRAQAVTIERDNDGAIDCARINVRSAVVSTKGGRVVKDPKSAAGVRKIPVFGHDAAIVAEQVQDKIGQALLFTDESGSGHLPDSTFYRRWDKARIAANRPGLHLHSLRHCAATRYAQVGPTLKEVMVFAGQSTVSAAMRYQHAADNARADELARAASRR